MVQDEVLFLLGQNRGKIVTGGELARHLGVSRTAVWKAIGALREGGNDIESMQGSGYRLQADSDGLSINTIAALLRTQRLGRFLEVRSAVNSTSTCL